MLLTWMGRILVLLCVITPLMADDFAYEEPKKAVVTIIAKENNASFPRMMDHLLRAQSQIPLEVRYLDFAKVRSKESLCQVCINADMIVTVGFEPTEATLEIHPKRPILSTLVRQNTYENLVATHKATADAEHQPQAAAVYLDHHPKYYFRLIRNIMPDAESVGTVGILLGSYSQRLEPLLRQEAEAAGLSLLVRVVKATEDPILAFDELVQNAAVILALPDPGVYNQHTAKMMLMAALHAKVPVVAYSKAYVEMGALAGLYADPEQIAKQTVEKILQEVQHSEIVPHESEYLKYFKVAINDELARSFGYPKQALSAITRAVDDDN